jgi:hypothetical protein
MQSPVKDRLQAADLVRAIPSGAVVRAEMTMVVAGLALVRADPVAVLVMTAAVVLVDGAGVRGGRDMALVVPVERRAVRMAVTGRRLAAIGVGQVQGNRACERRTGIDSDRTVSASATGRAIRKWTP